VASARPARAAPGTRKKLFTSGGALVAGLLLAELVVRVFDLAPAPLPQSSGRAFVPSDDPAIEFENAPGALFVMWTRASRGSPEIETVATVNDQGFRGPLVDLQAAPGTLRVACLGDSHTFGHGVGDGETWPDDLRALLGPRAGAAKVEVMNCGVKAYNTVQEVALLSRRVMPYAPDLVLLQYHLSDAVLRQAPDGADNLGFVLRWTTPRRGGAMRTARDASAFLDLFCDWTYRRALLPLQTEDNRTLYLDESPGWRAARAALLAARDLLDARGVPFAVVLYPYLVRNQGQYVSHDAFERVKAFCAESCIPCLDPEAAFLTVPDAELHVHPSDVHANARAHRILAGEVADWLEQTGLISQAQKHTL
jgi:lysophospholipase L1-like esterase